MCTCKSCGEIFGAKDLTYEICIQCQYCGESYESVTTEKQNMTPEEYVNETGKSRITSFWLTLFWGPIGLLYSSVVGGVIMILINISIAITSPDMVTIGSIIIWFLSIVMGDSLTYNYKKRLLAQAKFMKR